MSKLKLFQRLTGFGKTAKRAKNIKRASKLAKGSKVARKGGLMSNLAAYTGLGFLSDLFENNGSSEGADISNDREFSKNERPSYTNDESDKSKSTSESLYEIELTKAKSDKLKNSKLKDGIDKIIQNEEKDNSVVDKIKNKYGIDFKSDSNATLDSSKSSNIKIESESTKETPIIRVGDSNVSTDKLDSIESILKDQIRVLVSQNKLLFDSHLLESEKVDSELDKSNKLIVDLSSKLREEGSANKQGSITKIEPTKSEVSYESPKKIDFALNEPEDTESKNKKSEDEDEDEVDEEKSPIGKILGGIWDGIKGIGGLIVGGSLVGGAFNDGSNKGEVSGSEEFDRAAKNIGKNKNTGSLEGYSKGGFTKKGDKNEPAGVVHAGEWVASQDMVNDPKIRPTINKLEQIQENKRSDKIDSTSIEVNDTNSIPIKNNSADVESALRVSKTKVLSLAKITIGNSVSNVLKELIDRVIILSKQDSTIGPGIIDAIYQSLIDGFRTTNWYSSLINTLTQIGSDYPSLASLINASISKLTKINKTKSLNTLSNKILQLIKIANDNGWITNSPTDQYRKIVSQFGSNPSPAQIIKIESDLTALNQLNYKRSKLVNEDESLDLGNQSDKTEEPKVAEDNQSSDVDNSIQSDSSNSSSSFDYSGNEVNASQDTGGDFSEGTIGNGDGSAVVAEAQKFKGKLKYSQTGPRDPYKGSADCSSFTNKIYQKVTGLDIGDNSDTQLNSSVGKIVDRGSVNPDGSGGGKAPNLSNLQPGDILFQKRSGGKGRKYGVGHVSIYQGNGKVLSHGKGPGPYDVTIGPNFSKDYIAAKRYVNISGNKTNMTVKPNGPEGDEPKTSNDPKVTKNISNSDKTKTESNTKSSNVVVNAPQNKKVTNVVNNYISTNNAYKSEVN